MQNCVPCEERHLRFIIKSQKEKEITPMNNYGNYGYGYRVPGAMTPPSAPAMPYPTYQPYQQPNSQPMFKQEPMTTTRSLNELPIVNIMFANEQEANSYLPQPNTRVLFVNKEKGEAYLKSADNLGATYIEQFVYRDKNAVGQAPVVEKKTKATPKKEPYVTKKEFDEKIDELYKAIKESAGTSVSDLEVEDYE